MFYPSFCLQKHCRGTIRWNLHKCLKAGADRSNEWWMLICAGHSNKQIGEFRYTKGCKIHIQGRFLCKRSNRVSFFLLHNKSSKPSPSINLTKPSCCSCQALFAQAICVVNTPSVSQSSSGWLQTRALNGLLPVKTFTLSKHCSDHRLQALDFHHCYTTNRDESKGYDPGNKAQQEARQ